MGRKFGHGFYGGPLGWYSHYKDFVSDLDRGEVHGGERYDYEHLPIYSNFYRYHSGKRQAEDSWRNTGKDDYYGNRWMDGSLNSALGALASPLPGVRIPTMAKSLSKMYGAEVQLNAQNRLLNRKFALEFARQRTAARWRGLGR